MKKLSLLLNLLITLALTGCLGFGLAQVFVDVQQSAVTWCEASPNKCAEIEIRQIGASSTIPLTGVKTVTPAGTVLQIMSAAGDTLDFNFDMITNVVVRAYFATKNYSVIYDPESFGTARYKCGLPVTPEGNPDYSQIDLSYSTGRIVVNVKCVLP